MNSHKMKAISAEGYGNYHVLKLKEFEIPQPKEKEVLVKIHASSATTADSIMLSGKPYFGRLFTGIRKPKHAIPGTGFAGTVVSIGKAVSKFKIGAEVFGETSLNFSTNAEFVTVPENGIMLHKPENLSFAEAAPMCDGHLTSINFLKEIGDIKAGQNILIIGASGSLGTAAVQLAKYFGAEVTGVCSSANIGLVKSLGADHVVDYTKEDFTKVDKRYDIIYDTIGNSSFSKSKKVLKDRGIYMTPLFKLSLLFHLITSSIFRGKIAKFAATGLKSDDELRELLAELVEIYVSGKLKTVIDRQFPLERVAQAHKHISSGHKKGNVVIIVAS